MITPTTAEKGTMFETLSNLDPANTKKYNKIATA